MRTLVTANDSTWDKHRAVATEDAIKSLLKRHPGATVVVGQGHAHEGIAQIAAGLGASVHIYCNDVKTMSPPGLEIATKITIPSAKTRTAYNNFLVDSVAYIISIDQGNPLTLLGISKNKNVWFPTTGKIISGKNSN